MEIVYDNVSVPRKLHFSLETASRLVPNYESDSRRRPVEYTALDLSESLSEVCLVLWHNSLLDSCTYSSAYYYIDPLIKCA